jgi:hypothetical protein
MSDESKVNQGLENSGTINTGAGAAFGAVNTGGGSFNSGDNITVGDITGATGVAIGRGNQVSVTQGGGASADLGALFRELYKKIEARPLDPDVDKEELAETVRKVEQEAARGEQANASKVERWLKNLADMAPDILAITVACLTNPAAGVSTALQKIAARVRA